MVTQWLKIWECYEAKARGVIALGLITQTTNIENKTQTTETSPT